MNPKSWLIQGWQLGLAGSLALVAALGGASDSFWDSSASLAFAQIVPDDSLGAERSIVTPDEFDPDLDLITGGITWGTNLFHSFKQFNVSEGRGAFFDNPPGIVNILSRVTGSSRSEIRGNLGSNANLFLINPNGIIFGPNARLDVNGSFVATTAHTIQFGNQGFFSASTLNVPVLLTVNPSAFLFNQITTGAIANQSLTGLKVPDGKSLLLLGGNVRLEGGQVQVPGGRIELGGLVGAGIVGLNVDGNKLRLNFPQGVQRADVSLSNGARIDVSGEGGGDIQLSGRRITLTDGSQIVAQTLGSEPGGEVSLRADQLIVQNGAFVSASTFGTGRGGTLDIKASDSVQLIGTSADGQIPSALVTQTQGSGVAGNLRIITGRLIIRDGAFISANTIGTGQGGTLEVNASESVQLIGTSAQGLFLSGLFTQAVDAGVAGDIRIVTGRLMVQDGAQVSASTRSEGRGGRLTVTALDSVQLSGTSAKGIPSGLFAVTQGGSGSAGDLRIETRQLIVKDGAQVSASASGGAQGGGGSLAAIASESVELIGTAANSPLRSGLFVGTTGSKAAGNLTIETRRLVIQDGAVVSAGTLGEGKGGTLAVTASDSVQVLGTSANGEASSLLTQSSNAGAAGDLRIDTKRLIVGDRAQVTVSSQGLGSNAGSLSISAESIELSNQGKLQASTASGLGGNINLQVQDLILMRQNSLISAKADNSGNGGNITINAPFIVAVPSEDSDIIANAFRGQGGNIKITTQGIYGLEYRPQLTPKSDINASSEFGINGTVQINTPDVDPSRGLTNLPTEVVDASNQIAQNCPSGGGNVAQNEFIITGRGGLPDNPGETLSSDAVWTDLRSLGGRGGERGSVQRKVVQGRGGEGVRGGGGKSRIANRQSPIVEAQGWVMNDKGQVVLTASVPTVTPHSSGLISASCRRS